MQEEHSLQAVNEGTQKPTLIRTDSLIGLNNHMAELGQCEGGHDLVTMVSGTSCHTVWC